MELIKNTTFNQIKATYNGTTFTINNLNGMGVSYVDDSNPDLLKVTVTVCWRQKNGMVIGEDKDLDGVIDAGESSDAILDSPVQLVTYIAEDT